MRSRILVYALVSFIFGLFVFISCKSKSGSVQEVNTFASLVDTNRYIGKEECRKCHSDKFETFIHTGMGMSFDLATLHKSAAHFSSHELIYDKFLNFYYYPHFKDSILYLTEFRLKGKDTTYSRDVKIDYIVGSGQHTNSHLINVNNYIYQAPATFYTQSQKWDLPPGFENGFNNRFSRMIELECMSCHNAFPKIVLGSSNKYDEVPTGIDCERCHGPGSIHQQQKMAGIIVDVKNKIDYSIVNPAKLEINKQMDVCQRCHVQGNAIVKEGKSFFDFKPAMNLSDVMNIFMPLYKGDESSHIMASHAERLKLSKCFIETVKSAQEKNALHPTIEPYKNALTCITCHNPHVSVKSTNKEVFNNACKNCHNNSHETNSTKSVKVVECSASLKERMAMGNNCISCHMPKNGTIDIPHVTTTDHWIRKVVTKENSSAIREFVRLTCINNPSVDKRSIGDAYLSYYEKFVSKVQFLDSAKKYLDDSNQKAVRLNLSSLIRYAFLKNDFKMAIHYADVHGVTLDSLTHQSFSNSDAWTAYRIGQSYLNERDNLDGLKYLLRSVELAPFLPDFRIKLADLQLDSDDASSAEINYLFIIKENPNYTRAYVNYGYLLLSKKKDVRKAEDCYKKALSLEPDNIQALINLGGSSLFRSDVSAAKAYLKKALQIDPKNQEVIRLLRLI